MQFQCPQCEMTLLVAGDVGQGWFLCPFCQRSFELPEHTVTGQLLVAVDVSTSAVPFLANMQRETVKLRDRRVASHGCQMRIYTFHRQLTPFPCEQLCRPQSGASMIVPTLRDLRGRVAPGSAVLDALHQLLTEAEVHPGATQELILMTDGGERSSCRHPEELRRRIRAMPSDTTVRILGFADTSRHRSTIRLMRLLAAPRVMWSFHCTSRIVQTFPRPLAGEPLHLPTSQERESCRI